MPIGAAQRKVINLPNFMKHDSLQLASRMEVLLLHSGVTPEKLDAEKHASGPGVTMLAGKSGNPLKATDCGASSRTQGPWPRQHGPGLPGDSRHQFYGVTVWLPGAWGSFSHLHWV